MKMSDDDLISQIEHLERQAIGYYNTEVASEQAEALNFYLGKPFGWEEEGKSQVVSTDVWDVVEGLTPLVLKPFLATDECVQFKAIGAEDEDAAKQESDYINWVVTQRNDSFTELVNWCKTGLLQKNGIVKWWWEKSKRPTIERYYGVPDDVYAALTQEPDVEVVQHTEMTDETGAFVHDVVLRSVEEVGTAKFATLPPEEFLISRDATNPDPTTARFVEHRRTVTIGDLRAMGYDVDDDLPDGMDQDLRMSQQYLARRTPEETKFSKLEPGLDPTMREVLFKEVFMLADVDGDGEAELRKVCLVGREILANEETEEIPFAAWTPYQQPFKFYGRCPADETREVQIVKSTLWRQSLDNIYTINNNRTYANDDVNIDDLVDNQIAGVVRISGKGNVAHAVAQAEISPIGAIVQPMIEYLDTAKENRTGFTRYNQGLDANSLNKTATGVRLISEAGNQRVELIARQFANGLAALMRGIHGLCRRHATKAETIRLRGEWVQIDPRAWKSRYDMTVSVGLGVADQQMKMQGAQIILNEQKQLMAAGVVTPENLVHAASRLVETVGYRNPEQFFTEPKPQEGLDPRVKEVLQHAQQEIQDLHQQVQELQSGLAAKQMDIQGKVQIEQMQQQAATQQQQFEAFMQQMKDHAAYERTELQGLVALLAKQVTPPTALTSDVNKDLAEDNDGQA